MEWAKYGLAGMLGGSLLLLFGKRGTGRDKWLFGIGFGGSLAAMELVVEYIWNRVLWEMIVSALKGAALFSAVVLAGYVWEWVRDRRKGQGEEELLSPIRQWMDDYQESFRQLSRSFGMIPQAADGTNRADLIWQARLRESRLAAAGQIEEMSVILEGAMERMANTKENADLEQETAKRLHRMGIQLGQALFCNRKGRKGQIYLTMKTRRKICVPMKKVAAVLSEVTGTAMMPARDSRSFVSQEKATVLFVEEVAYNVFYGVKKTTRQNEPVSGDNFSTFWLPEGRFYAGLSDGMGSGVQACSQSELVLDLLEQFLEAGFSRETALRMINSAIVLRPETPVFATIDVAALDLYTGVCEFVKIGAAPSFLKRGNRVERITGEGLPAGVGNELPLTPTRVRMYDGNMLFLLTDGVISALPEGREEEILTELIQELPEGSPAELAGRLMEQVQAYGGTRDDMTVLAVGLWRR